MALLDLKQEVLDDPPSITKGLADARWGFTDIGEQQVSVKSAITQHRSLTPKECYELSIPVRKAVSTIAKNVKKARIRIFDRNGDEFLDGDLFHLFHRPMPHMSQGQFLEKLVIWYCIQNELAVSLGQGDSAPVDRMLPLDPNRLFVNRPKNEAKIKSVDDVVQWRYQWDGYEEFISSRYLLYEHGFNPNSTYRGLSPLITGRNEVGSSYYGAKHNADIFRNHGIPSHIVVLPSGTPKQEREAFTSEYLAQYGWYGGNAHKVMVVAGDDVKVEQLDRGSREGEYVNLSRLSAAAIASLFDIPSIEMGALLSEGVRFETADTERQQFFEGTLADMLQTIGDALQIQVADRFAWKPGTRGGSKMSKSITKAFEDRIENRPDSDLVILLDGDTMPIMAHINKRRTEYAKELIENLRLSPQEASEYVGLDIPEDETDVRKTIWVQSGWLPVSNDAMMEKVQPKPVEKDPTKKRPSEANPDAPVGEHSRAAPVKKELTDEQKDEARRIERLVQTDLRKAWLKAAETGGLPTLDALDAVVGANTLLRLESRSDYAELALGGGPGDAASLAKSIKDHFNRKYTKSFCHSLV